MYRRPASFAVLSLDPLAEPPLINENVSQQKLRVLNESIVNKSKTPQAVKITKTYPSSFRFSSYAPVFTQDFPTIDESKAVQFSVLSLKEQGLVFNKIVNLEIGVKYDGTFSGSADVYFALQGQNLGKTLSFKIGEMQDGKFEPTRGVADNFYQEKLILFTNALEVRNDDDFTYSGDQVLFTQLLTLQNKGDFFTASICTTGGSGGNFSLSTTLTFLALQQST